MSSTLFDLDEITEAWKPMYKPFGMTLASVITPDLCRDCGAKTSNGTGGTRDAGIFTICPGCEHLDECETRTSIQGGHLSRWGASHAAEDHDDLVEARKKRRAMYRRRTAA